jgi:hypothetical protein
MEHLFEQYQLLLQNVIDAEKFNEMNDAFIKLHFIYRAGFIEGVISPIRTYETYEAEKHELQKSNSIDEVNKIYEQISIYSKEIGAKIWEDFLNIDKSKKYIGELLIENYEFVTAEKIFNLYLKGLSKGTYLGIVKVKPYLSMNDIASETERYCDVFLMDFFEDRKYMNKVMKQIISIIKEKI